MKEQLHGFVGARIIFEHTIPRMGKRVDVVVLHKRSLRGIRLAVLRTDPAEKYILINIETDIDNLSISA